MDKRRKELCLWSRRRALELGADAVRARIGCDSQLSVELRDGEPSRSSSEDSNILSLALYRDGRSTTLRTNRLGNRRSIEGLIRRSLDICTRLEADPDATLPPKALKYRSRPSEKQPFDEACRHFGSGQLLELARSECRCGRLRKAARKKGLTLVSEVVTVSCSRYESFCCDSDDFEGERQVSGWMIESEVTVKDAGGALHAQYACEYSVRLDRLRRGICSRKAFRRCLQQIGSAPCPGFTGTMVVESSRTGKLISPIENALRGENVWRDQSFLKGRLGEKVFSGHFTLTDRTHRRGHQSCRHFDSEGVATRDRKLIDRGVIRHFIVSTLAARKTGLPQTASESGSLTVTPFLRDLHPDKKTVNLQDILSGVKDGIYVTGFNGGNSNALTGDFSYGIEGRRIRDGKLAEPVSGMVVTGNLTGLFGQLVAAGSDYSRSATDAVGTLAFENVTFNA